MTETNTTKLIDDFVGVRAGAPYRLFPFGKIIKNGNVREITPEVAKSFKLPHFKPAIKLGSHDDPTPAGGHIVALEVRADGLYAVPEWNDKGETAIQDGAYRYHSPEVIWEGGALEDPNTGDLIEGPLIVGDALLHMPHLGEAARLYSVEPISKGEKDMTVETVEVPKTVWEKLTAIFDKQPEPLAPEPLNIAETDEFKAAVKERDEYKAQLDAIQAEKDHAARVEKFAAELDGVKTDPELAEILADLPKEKAAKILQQVKALSAQAEAGNIEGEIGTDAEADPDPAAAFNSAVMALAQAKGMNYADAFNAAKIEHKDLFDAYVKGEK